MDRSRSKNGRGTCDNKPCSSRTRHSSPMNVRSISFSPTPKTPIQVLARSKSSGFFISPDSLAKRSRGRPKKTVTVIDELTSDEEEPYQRKKEVETPRKRCRPSTTGFSSEDASAERRKTPRKDAESLKKRESKRIAKCAHIDSGTVTTEEKGRKKAVQEEENATRTRTRKSLVFAPEVEEHEEEKEAVHGKTARSKEAAKGPLVCSSPRSSSKITPEMKDTRSLRNGGTPMKSPIPDSDQKHSDQKKKRGVKIKEEIKSDSESFPEDTLSVDQLPKRRGRPRGCARHWKMESEDEQMKDVENPSTVHGLRSGGHFREPSVVVEDEICDQTTPKSRKTRKTVKKEVLEEDEVLPSVEKRSTRNRPHRRSAHDSSPEKEPSPSVLHRLRSRASKPQPEYSSDSDPEEPCSSQYNMRLRGHGGAELMKEEAKQSSSKSDESQSELSAGPRRRSQRIKSPKRTEKQNNSDLESGRKARCSMRTRDKGIKEVKREERSGSRSTESSSNNDEERHSSKEPSRSSKESSVGSSARRKNSIPQQKKVTIQVPAYFRRVVNCKEEYVLNTAALGIDAFEYNMIHKMTCRLNEAMNARDHKGICHSRSFLHRNLTFNIDRSFKRGPVPRLWTDLPEKISVIRKRIDSRNFTPAQLKAEQERKRVLLNSMISNMKQWMEETGQRFLFEGCHVAFTQPDNTSLIVYRFGLRIYERVKSIGNRGFYLDKQFRRFVHLYLPGMTDQMETEIKKFNVEENEKRKKMDEEYALWKKAKEEEENNNRKRKPDDVPPKESSTETEEAKVERKRGRPPTKKRKMIANVDPSHCATIDEPGCSTQKKKTEPIESESLPEETTEVKEKRKKPIRYKVEDVIYYKDDPNLPRKSTIKFRKLVHQTLPGSRDCRIQAYQMRELKEGIFKQFAAKLMDFQMPVNDNKYREEGIEMDFDPDVHWRLKGEQKVWCLLRIDFHEATEAKQEIDGHRRRLSGAYKEAPTYYSVMHAYKPSHPENEGWQLGKKAFTLIPENLVRDTTIEDFMKDKELMRKIIHRCSCDQNKGLPYIEYDFQFVTPISDKTSGDEYTSSEETDNKNPKKNKEDEDDDDGSDGSTASDDDENEDDEDEEESEDEEDESNSRDMEDIGDATNDGSTIDEENEQGQSGTDDSDEGYTRNVCFDNRKVSAKEARMLDQAKDVLPASAGIAAYLKAFCGLNGVEDVTLKDLLDDSVPYSKHIDRFEKMCDRDKEAIVNDPTLTFSSSRVASLTFPSQIIYRFVETPEHYVQPTKREKPTKEQLNQLREPAQEDMNPHHHPITGKYGLKRLTCPTKRPYFIFAGRHNEKKIIRILNWKEVKQLPKETRQRLMKNQHCTFDDYKKFNPNELPGEEKVKNIVFIKGLHTPIDSWKKKVTISKVKKMRKSEQFEKKKTILIARHVDGALQRRENRKHPKERMQRKNKMKVLKEKMKKKEHEQFMSRVSRLKNRISSPTPPGYFPVMNNEEAAEDLEEDDDLTKPGPSSRVVKKSVVESSAKSSTTSPPPLLKTYDEDLSDFSSDKSTVETNEVMETDDDSQDMPTLAGESRIETPMPSLKKEAEEMEIDAIIEKSTFKAKVKEEVIDERPVARKTAGGRFKWTVKHKDIIKRESELMKKGYVPGLDKTLDLEDRFLRAFKIEKENRRDRQSRRLRVMNYMNVMSEEEQKQFFSEWQFSRDDAMRLVEEPLTAWEYKLLDKSISRAEILGFISSRKTEEKQWIDERNEGLTHETQEMYDSRLGDLGRKVETTTLSNYEIKWLDVPRTDTNRCVLCSHICYDMFTLMMHYTLSHPRWGAIIAPRLYEGAQPNGESFPIADVLVIHMVLDGDVDTTRELLDLEVPKGVHPYLASAATLRRADRPIKLKVSRHPIWLVDGKYSSIIKRCMRNDMSIFTEKLLTPDVFRKLNVTKAFGRAEHDFMSWTHYRDGPNGLGYQSHKNWVLYRINKIQTRPWVRPDQCVHLKFQIMWMYFESSLKKGHLLAPLYMRWRLFLRCNMHIIKAAAGDDEIFFSMHIFMRQQSLAGFMSNEDWRDLVQRCNYYILKYSHIKDWDGDMDYDPILNRRSPLSLYLCEQMDEQYNKYQAKLNRRNKFAIPITKSDIPPEYRYPSDEYEDDELLPILKKIERELKAAKKHAHVLHSTNEIDFFFGSSKLTALPEWMFLPKDLITGYVDPLFLPKAYVLDRRLDQCFFTRVYYEAMKKQKEERREDVERNWMKAIMYDYHNQQKTAQIVMKSQAQHIHRCSQMF